jgi:hypothetical protein
MESTFLPYQVDYKMRSTTTPKYRLLKVPLNNVSSSSINIASANTQTLLEFKLPASVYNLGKSYIAYEYTIPSTNSITTLNYYFNDAEISSVQFTNGSTDLVNFNNIDRYNHIWKRINTSKEDLQRNSVLNAMDKSGGRLSSDHSVYTNYMNGTPTTGSGLENGVLPTFNDYKTAGNIADNYRHISTEGGAAINTVFRHLKFEDNFNSTILGVNKDVYFGTDMFLRVFLNPTNKWILIGNQSNHFEMQPINATNSVLQTFGNGTVQTFNQALVLNNIFVYLAIEDNTILKESVLEKYRSGNMKLTIPYTQSFRTGSTSTSTNLSIQLNRNYGRQLKRIMFCGYQGSETGMHTYNCSNGLNTNAIASGASKITSYQTYLNAKPLQDQIVECNNTHTDYLTNKEWVENSSIPSVGDYRHTWFHIDNFSHIVDKKDLNYHMNDMIDDGLNLDLSGHTYSVQMTNTRNNSVNDETENVGIAFYIFVTLQRDILCSNGQIQLL